MNIPENSEKKKIAENIAFWTLLAALVLLPLYFVNKAVDLSDTGFYLANYKWDLQTAGVLSSSIALSNAVGSFVYQMLGSHQLLVLRLLHAVVTWTVCFSVYQMIGRKKNWILLLGMLLGFVMTKRFPMALSYLSFTVFFCALAMCCLVTGLRKEKNLWFLAAGALAGINVLFRTPNLSQATMILAIPLYGWLSGWSWKKTGKYSLGFLAGYGAGLAVGVVISASVLGWDTFLAGYTSLANVGVGSESAHSIENMIYAVVKDMLEGGVLTIRYGIKTLAAALCTAQIISMLRRSMDQEDKREDHWKRVLLICAIALGLFFGLRMLKAYNQKYFRMYYRLCAIACLTGLFTLLFGKLLSPMHNVLGYLLGSSVMYVVLGTDNSLIEVCIFGPAVIGLLVMLLWDWVHVSRRPRCAFLAEFLPHIRFTALTLLITVLVELLFLSHLLLPYSYGDTNLPALTTEVKVPELAGMKTSPERAQMLETIYEEMQNPAFEGYTLANSSNFCLAYVICDQQPYFESMWTALDTYFLDQYIDWIEMKEAQGDLPIILAYRGRYKNNTCQEKYELLWDLAERNDYACVSKHEQYHILVPRDCFQKMDGAVDLGLDRNAFPVPEE